MKQIKRLKKNKLIICTDGIFPHSIGGIQRHSAHLIEGLAKKTENEIVVIHPHTERLLFSEYENITEEVIDSKIKSHLYFLQLYFYSKEVYNIVKRYHDYVILSQGITVCYGLKNIKNRLITIPHGLEPFQTVNYRDKFKSLPLRVISKYLFRNSRFVVSLGGKLTEIIERNINSSKIVSIPNAVSVNEEDVQFSGVQNEKVKVLFVGRFVDNKGISFLLEAIRLLNKEYSSIDLTFEIAGSGPLFEKYKAEYDFANCIYHGFVSDEELERLYSTCDVFLLPTLYEGMPTVILEAMSCAKPIIATNVGAIPELVDSSNGIIIEPGNSESICNAILKFASLSIDEKSNMGISSYNKVCDRFNWEKVIPKYEELINVISR